MVRWFLLKYREKYLMIVSYVLQNPWHSWKQSNFSIKYAIGDRNKLFGDFGEFSRLFVVCFMQTRFKIGFLSNFVFVSIEEHIVKSVLECVMHEEMRTSSSTHQRVHCNGEEIFLWPARIVS
jgi:hypothetical protein